MVLLASLIFGPSRHRGPTLASADFYRFISAPFDANSSLQIDRSPRVLRTHLHAYVRRIYALAFWTSSGLGISSPAHPTRSPSIRCVFLGPALCPQLLTPPHAGRPCRSANTSPCRVGRGLAPPSECALPGALKKKPHADSRAAIRTHQLKKPRLRRLLRPSMP